MAKTYAYPELDIDLSWEGGIDPDDWRKYPEPDSESENDEDEPASDYVKDVLGFDPDELDTTENVFVGNYPGQPRDAKGRFAVGISKSYFPKEIHPKERLTEIFHSDEIEAGNREEAAAAYWKKHGEFLLPKMTPRKGKLPRKVSVYSGKKGSVSGSWIRLSPVTVFEGFGPKDEGVNNVFCPTGKGGGIDPTCGYSKGGIGGAAAKSGTLADAVAKATGFSRKQLQTALTSQADPVSTQGQINSKIRAAVTSHILQSGSATKNAILKLMDSHSPEKNATYVNSITKGNTAKAAKEYSSTPLYDLHCLSEIEVSNSPVQGQAVCYMNTRKVKMGSTSATGDYRHELGHALRASLGGVKSTDRTAATKAIADTYDKVQAKVKADPTGLKTKLDHESYELKYGVVGRRSLDNWEENAAEHYRLYHRELYRDKYEGGNGKWLEQYRTRHPDWAAIWDAHYTTALLGAELNEAPPPKKAKKPKAIKVG